MDVSWALKVAAVSVLKVGLIGLTSRMYPQSGHSDASARFDRESQISAKNEASVRVESG
jgi:hypothetical protein